MKRILSIILSVAILIGTLTVLTLLPVSAENAGPINLVKNGDFEGIDTDNDGVKDKIEYTTDDQANASYDGEMVDLAPVGWRTNGTSKNIRVVYPSTLSPAGYLANYNHIAATINQGQKMYQDVRIEAGKTYTVSALTTVRPHTADKTAQTSWKFAIYLDANTGIADATVPSGVDWLSVKFHKYTAIADTTYYGVGDFSKQTFTFKADDFIAANNLTAGEDGKYHARLVFHNYDWSGSFSGLVDDVTMYEVVAFTAGDGGYISGTQSGFAGEAYQSTAVPFYGNTFAGWYDGDRLVTTEATISGKLSSSLTAKFNVYNQITDGNFESGTTAGQDYLNAEPHSANSGHAVVIENPTTSATIHGNYVLKVDTTTAANTNADIVTIPFDVKKNTRYVFHLSYYSVDIDATAYVGLHSETSFKNGWTRSTFVKNLTYHWEKEGTTNLGSWSVFGGYGGSYGMMREQTHATVNAGKNGWVDLWVTFDTAEETSIFADGKDTAHMFFLLGVSNTTINTFYLDNISLTEAGTTQSSVITALAGKNGSVSTAMTYIPDPVCYVDFGGAKKGQAATAVDGTTAYAQIPINRYTATPSEGFSFAGWYDASNKLVSTNPTETFYAEGVYTAKFASAPYAEDGGYVVASDNDTYTAKAYYGNKFLGWYDMDEQLISTEETVATQVGMHAKFEKHNLIYNGDFATDYVNYYVQNSSSSASIKTDKDGNRFLRMESVTTGNALYSFQWNFKLEKNKKYVISYKLRSGIDENGNYLSTQDMAFRRILLYNQGNRSYAWSDPLFAEQIAMTSGSKQSYISDVDLLPSGGSDLNPSGSSTSFPGVFTKESDEWTYYSIVLDTSSAVLANGTDISENIDLALIFGANGGGTMALDIDDISVSEVKNVISIATTDGGNVMADRLASTKVIPATITAVPKDESYMFLGWVDSNGNPLSATNPYVTFEAANLTGNFAYFDPEGTQFQVNAKIEKQNGIYGGYITGNKTAEGVIGTTVTFTAVPYAGNTFDGWYIDGQKVSSNAQYTFYIARSCDIVAKFNINNLWPDSGYENTIRNTSILSDKIFEIDPNGYAEWHSYNPSLWWDAKVLTSKPYSGEASLELTHRNNEVLRKIDGLEKNTDYELSFYWFIRNSLSAGAGSAPSHLKSVSFYDKDGKKFSSTILDAQYNADFQQTKVYFNSGDYTEIYVAITYYAGSSTIVCDDFCLMPGKSDDYVTVSYDSGDERIGIITELAHKGSYVIKAPSSLPPAKDFVNWSMGANTYVKNDTINLTGDITLTANYKDFTSPNLSTESDFDPDNYDFTFVVLPDEQKLLINYPDYYVDIADWISGNKDAYNIAAVLSMGDLTENGSYNQWYNVSNSFSSVIGKIPFAISLGNHDYINGASTGAYNATAERKTGLFNSMFKQSQFNTLPQWGGAYDDSMDNTYHKINVNGVKLMIISLELYPRYDVIKWAGELCEQNPDYKVIVTTHAHLAADGTRATDAESPYIFTNPEDSSNPQELYDQLLKVYPNIIMLLCGHESNSQTKVNTTKGDNGNTIYEILMDNQNDDINYKGVGNIVLMGFYDNGNMVDFTSYSTVQDKYFCKGVNEFTLALDKTVDSTSGGDVSYDKAVVGGTLITTYTAVPYYGNTFVGWYDIDGNLVSKNLTHATATYNYLKAVFSGPNTIRNGDIEGDEMPSIIFSNTNRLTISQFDAALSGHGNGYLKFSAPSQETVQTGFALNVEKDTDYSLSFDLKITDFGANGGLRIGFMYNLLNWESSAIMGATTQFYKNPTTGYTKTYSTEAGTAHRPGGNLAYTEYTDKFGSDWVRFTISFNSGSDPNVFTNGDKGTVYLMIQNLNNGLEMQLDNFILAAASEVIAEADVGGFAAADKDEAVIGTEITFTATPEYGNGFDGWYDAAGNIVSYYPTFTTTEYIHLIAKFKVFNSISDGGFEQGTTGEWFANKGVTLENAVHTDISDSEFGNRYLKVTDNATGYLNFGLPIKAEPGTQYLVHFSFKVTSTTNSRIDITLSPKNSWGAFANSTTYLSTEAASETDTSLYDNKYPNTITRKFGDGFIEANIIVNTAEELADGETMYLLMGAKADGIYYIDNVSVMKVDDIAPSILGATLVTEAGKYKEGTISYKSDVGFIPTSSVLTEIGTIAMPTQLFTGELTWDVPGVSYAALSNSAGINLVGNSFYATFTNTDTINPSAKISARSYCKITDKYGKFNWTFYSGNEDASKAIVGGTYNRSVNQVKRLLAVALIDAFAGNYPADFWSDSDVNETTNVKSSASVSVDKVWNFIKRNAHLQSGVNNSVPEKVNLINDGSFENDEFYVGNFENRVVTDNPYSYTTYNESNGICYAYDHNGFIYYSGSDYIIGANATFDSYFSIDSSYAHTGNRSLRLSTRAGTASYILRDLIPNTDYEFSFYWYAQTPVFLGRAYIYPHKFMNAGYSYYQDIEIDGVKYRQYKYGEAEYLAPKLLSLQSYALDYQLGPMYANWDWQKVTLRFNSGDDTEAVFGLGYGSRLNSGTVWIDDLSLTQIDAPTYGIENGNFENGRNGWEGSASTYDIDGEPSATLTERGQYLKQSATVKRYTDYTLTVKAKTSEAGALYFGVTDAGATTLNPTTSYSANSSMTTDKTGVSTYKVSFNSSDNSAVDVFLQSVCDSKVSILSVSLDETEELITYESVDFENSMIKVEGGFAPAYTIAKTNKLWYAISSSTAHSGKYSLRMNATSSDTDPKSDVTTNDGDLLRHPLYQAWSTFRVNPGEWYTISYYVKADKAGTSFDSSIRTVDSGDWDYMHALDKQTVTLSNTEWTLVTHTFANDRAAADACNVNLVFSANDSTTSNLHFDDIQIKRTNAIASSDPVTAPYTESLYNLVSDGSFENGNSLYSGGTFMSSSDAYDGGKYLRVSAGQKLIVPINTRIDYNYKDYYNYTLSAAIRSSASGAGYIGISATADGKTPVLNADGSIASIKASGTNWSFGAFKYLSPDVRPTYLVIECTAGYIDIDYVSFFSDIHAFENRPNETADEAYDYDDMSNAVEGGGTAGAGAATLTVNNTTSGIVNDTFSGLTSTVYFPLIDDVMGRDFTEEQLHEELTRMKNAGITRVRTMFRSQWAYTGDVNNPWDWNSSEMQQFYKWCQLLEDYGIDVMILCGWHLSSAVYGSSSIPEVDYLSPRIVDANGNIQYAISWGIFHPAIDLDLAADRYATWMTEAVLAIRNHGVTNLTHVLSFYEPSQQNGSL